MAYVLTPEERRARLLRKKEETEQLKVNRINQLNLSTKQEQEQTKEEEPGFFVRAISTIGDIAGNVITGVSKGLEGIYDMGVGIVGAVGGVFDKNFQQKAQEHIAYDWTSENIGNPLQELTKHSYTNDGYAGQVIEGVANSIGQILPSVAVTVATGGAGAPALVSQLAGTGTFIASSAGQGIETAYNEGADYYAGLGYGALTGAVEGAIEKISGGVAGKVFGKGAIDGLTKNLSTKIASNKTAQKGLEILGQAGGESAEEWVSTLINPYLKRITYDADAELSTTQERLEAALIGGLTSIAYRGTIGQIGAKRNNAQESINSLKELETEDFSRWSRGEFSEELQQQSAQKRNDIYKEISSSLQKTNEKTRNELINRNRLENIVNNDGTLKDNIINTYKSEQNVNEQAQYNKASYSPKLWGKEENLLFKPTKSPLNQDEKLALKTFDELNRGKDKAQVVFVDDIPTPNGTSANGVYHNGIIYVARNSKNPTQTVLMHELTHHLEGTKQYAKYQQYILANGLLDDKMMANIQKITGKQMTLNEILELYSKETNTTIEKQLKMVLDEATAIYTSENFFTNQQAIEKLYNQDKNLFQKIWDWIKECINRLKNKKNLSKEEQDLQKFLSNASNLYKKALNNAREEIKETTQEKALDKTAEVRYSKKGYARRDETTVTKQEYEHHYWATANEVLSKSNIGQLENFINNRENLSKLPKSADGLYMIAVGENGVNNKIVFTDADVDGYSINRVLEINLNNETDLDFIRRDIYDGERRGIQQQNSGLFRLYDATFIQYLRWKQQRDGIESINDYERSGNRRSSSERTQRTESDDVNIDIRYSLNKNENRIDTYTEKQYNNFGWVRANNVLSKAEWQDFNSKFIMPTQQIKENPTINDELIIPVNSNGDDFGIDNTLVFAKGTYENPIVTKIIKINLYNENDIDIVRRYIYARERGNRTSESPIIENIFRERFVREFGIKDFPNYKEYIRENSKQRSSRQQSQTVDRTNQFLQDRAGDLGQTRNSEIDDRKYSLNNDAFDEIVFGNNDEDKPKQNKNLISNKTFSAGEHYKALAQYTKDRVYSKDDAKRIVNELIENELHLNDKYKIELGKSNEKEIIDKMWVALNSSKKTEQNKIAQDITDYLLSKCKYEVVTDDYFNESNRIVNTIKSYMHKINLSGIKDEIRYKTGNNGLIVVWGARNGQKGISPDVIAQELEAQGIYFESTSSAGIFFEMIDKYNNAKSSIDKNNLLKTVDEISENEDFISLRGNLVNEILRAFNSHSFNNTKYNKIKQRINKLKTKLQDVKSRSNAILHLSATIDRIKKLENVPANMQNADIVNTMIKKLKKSKTYIGNLSANLRNIINEFNPIYDNFLKIVDNTTANPYQQQLDEIAKQNGELTTKEIEILDAALKNFIYEVKNFNKVFFNEKWQNETNIAEEAINNAQDLMKTKQTGTITSLLNSLDSCITPQAFIEKNCGYNKDTFLYKYYNKDFIGGEKRRAELLRDADNIFSDLVNNKQYKNELKNFRKQDIEFKGIKISIGQKISLIMTTEREQAKKHLFEGGIKFADEKQAYKRNWKLANLNGKTLKITEEDIIQLKSTITPFEKEYINCARKLFDGLLKEAKTKTDIQIFGATNAVEDNYIPIRVDSDELYQTIGDEMSATGSIFQDAYSIYNMPFNKSTKQNANNRIMIENIDDIINRHISQMSLYYGFAVPIRTYNRVANRKVNGATLRTSMDRVNIKFNDYMKQLFLDTQGMNKDNSSLNRALNYVRNASYKATLGFNLKSWSMQFISLISAQSSGIKSKHLIKGISKAVAKRTDWEKLEQYSPLAYARFKEGFNVDMGRLKSEYAYLGKIDKLTDWLVAPLSKIDRLVCGAIWNASLEQSKVKFEVGSEEYYKEASKLFDNALIRTQANWSSSMRPAIMRSNNWLAKFFTMYMSEPLQMLSRLYSAVNKCLTAKKLIKSGNARGNELLKEGRSSLKSELPNVILSIIMASLIAELFKKLLNKDKEDFPNGLGEEVISNIVGMFPLVRDFWSMYQGYEVTNSAYSGMTNIYRGVKSVFDSAEGLITGDMTMNDVAQKLHTSTLGISQLLGIPLRNLEKYTIGWFKQGTSTKSNVSNILDASASSLINKFKSNGFDISIKNVNSKVTFDGEEIELNNTQQRQVASLYAQANLRLAELQENETYQNATEEVQSKSVKLIYDYYYYDALYQVLGIDNNTKLRLFGTAINITQFAAIVQQARALKEELADKPTDYRKNKLQVFINSTSLSSAQKYMIMGYLGYKNTKGSAVVKRYIQSLNLTKEEKVQLYSYSGY